MSYLEIKYSCGCVKRLYPLGFGTEPIAQGPSSETCAFHKGIPWQFRKEIREGKVKVLSKETVQ
jgi:hypothetical protein